MKWLIVIGIVIIIALQIRIWSGDGGMVEIWGLQEAVEKQRKANAVLKARNEALEAEVIDLKEGLDAIEERARSELGMIKKDESFFQITDN